MGIIVLGDYTACFAQGNYLYVTNANPSELKIYDISDPENPSVISTFTLPSDDPEAIQIYDGLCYIACAQHILTIDVDNPAVPVLKKNTSVPGGDLVALKVIGDTIFVAGTHVSHIVNDLGTDPIGLDTEEIPAGATAGISVQGRSLYTVDFTGGRLRSFRIGGFYCPFITTGSLDADEITTELLRSRHGYFKGELTASSIGAGGGNSEEDRGVVYAANYMKIGQKFIFVSETIPDPNGLITATRSSLFLASDGTVWRNTNAVTTWVAM